MLIVKRSSKVRLSWMPIPATTTGLHPVPIHNTNQVPLSLNSKTQAVGEKANESLSCKKCSDYLLNKDNPSIKILNCHSPLFSSYR